MAQPLDTQECESRRGLACERLQLGVIIAVLTMSVSWIFAYTAVVNAPVGARSLSPTIASQLRREHAAEMIRIEAQTAEVYGPAKRPEPAGS
jgi:hypothetical protein